MHGEGSSAGVGRGRGYLSNVKFWNYGEWGHISPNCDKATKAGGEVYPRMHRMNDTKPDRSGDYCRGDAGDEENTEYNKKI